MGTGLKKKKKPARSFKKSARVKGRLGPVRRIFPRGIIPIPGNKRSLLNNRVKQTYTHPLVF